MSPQGQNRMSLDTKFGNGLMGTPTTLANSR